MSDQHLRSNSCIELSEIRKLDRLLSQCETSSCENLYYEFCSTFDSLNSRMDLSENNVINLVPVDEDVQHDEKYCFDCNQKSRSCIQLSNNINNRSRSRSGGRGRGGVSGGGGRSKCCARNNHQPLPIIPITANKLCKLCGKLQLKEINEKIVKILSNEITDIKLITNEDDDIEDNDGHVNINNDDDDEIVVYKSSSQNSIKSEAKEIKQQQKIEPHHRLSISTTHSNKIKSKFSPQILARKITGKNNNNTCNENDHEKSAKESLLGHCRVDSFLIDKKLPETVETVRI